MTGFRALLPTLVLCLLGCDADDVTPDGGITLADAGSVSLQVFTSPLPSASLYLYHSERFRSGLAARVEGQAMQLITHGGPQRDDAGYLTVVPTEFQMSRGTSVPTGPGPVTFTLSDGTATWTLELGHAFTPRSMHLRTPDAGVLHAGDEVVLEIQPGVLTQYNHWVTFLPADGGTHEAFRVAATLDGGLIASDNVARFIVPAPAWTGPGVLQFRGGSVNPVSRCEGPTSCSSLMPVVLEAPATLAP
jgi:hypothetical protein